MEGERIAGFVEEARLAAPSERIESWKTRSFGNTAELADTLIGLIASGAKTGTFSLPIEYRDRPGAAPVVGDYFVVTRFDGSPALLYRVTEVERLPFESIAQQHVDCEGPQLRDVAAWGEFHWQYWRSLLGRHGEEPRRDMPVIFQRFRLIHVRAG